MPESTAFTPATAQVLVIDDEPDLRTLYELTLLREGYRVETAGSLAEARQQLEAGRFSAVITDMRLPDGLGLSLLRDMQGRQRPERCIVMTAYGSAENAVEALKAGAFDYLTKPVDLKQFRATVAAAILETAAAEPGAARPRSTPPAPGAPETPAAEPRGATASPEHPALRRIVGQSAAVRRVKERIVKVARSMAPVLVRGESGTGKELVARAVHACSHRADGPFIAVNCSAIPEALLEAEFFGARKGSYTGAAQDRDGFFQAAQSGTLFLDEIGDLPLPMQSKLLRAIQERSIRPLGATQEVQVDVRIVSATHKDLAADVQTQRFRQDLFYRLNVIEIAVPPLRERCEDLPALCQALLQRIAADSGLQVPALSAAVLAQIAALPLPGNVRELENLLHRAVALSDGDELHLDATATPAPSIAPAPSLAPAPTQAPAAAPAPLRTEAPAAAPGEPPAQDGSPGEVPHDLTAYLDQQERDILMRVLKDTGFNRTAAAARLGISLRQIRYRITRLHIPMPQGSGDESSEETGDAA